MFFFEVFEIDFFGQEIGNETIQFLDCRNSFFMKFLKRFFANKRICQKFLEVFKKKFFLVGIHGELFTDSPPISAAAVRGSTVA